jgi:GNAT superfamily N-acetyltransferase
MEFQLSPELLDQIIFGMENQDEDFYVDTKNEDLVPASQIEPEAEAGRYIPIPEWRSVDGYNLMEKFVSTLHNPIYRETLRRILASGKGVFRQFKDALKERKEIERLWYNFKERYMRDVVLDWYNELRESWGLNRVELEIPEDTEQLVLTDFIIAPAEEARLQEITECDRLAFVDMFPGRKEAFAEYMRSLARPAEPDLADPRSVVLAAVTPTGELAGFLWVLRDELTDGEVIARLRQIYVRPEYRGLGLARTMITEYLKEAHYEGVRTFLAAALGAGQVLADVFTQESGVLLEQTYEIDLRRWYLNSFLS